MHEELFMQVKQSLLQAVHWYGLIAESEAFKVRLVSEKYPLGQLVVH